MSKTPKQSASYYNSLSDLDVILTPDTDSDDFALPSEVECKKCGYPFLSHSSNPYNLVCQPCKRPWSSKANSNAPKQYSFSTRSYKQPK